MPAKKLLTNYWGLYFILGLLLASCSKNSSHPPSERTTAHTKPPSADLIFTDAKIYSLNWGEPDSNGLPAKNAPHDHTGWHADADALAIKDGQILYVGNNAEALGFKNNTTRIVSLNGATIIPGVIDSHVHIEELGAILNHVNLIGTPTPEDAIMRIHKQFPTIADGSWIIGQGWDEGAWANHYPNKHILDKAFPNHPVVLKSLHGFAVWANSLALEKAHIVSGTPAPIGGKILTDKTGAPTGILLNRATTLLLDAIPEISEQQLQNNLINGLSRMARDGFVAIHQAGADGAQIKAFQRLNSQHKLPVRVYAMLSVRDHKLAQQWAKRGPLTDDKGWLDIRSVKAFYDGALGSRGARLLEDYSDMPGHKGVSGDGYGFDGQVVKSLMAAGFQIAVHAIGDAGNRETLNYFEKIYQLLPQTRQQRNRIEHAQVVNPDDFVRFKSLSIIASMEPHHAVEDMPWAEKRLGAERIKGAYAWRSMRKAGVRLTFNSDLPGSTHSIFSGLHAAVTRQNDQSQPAEGWHKEQALTIEESIRAYTNWAAYAEFREKQTGIIKKDYWADLTIMDIDPFKTGEQSPEKLLQGKILMTIIDGKIVSDNTGH